MVTAPEAAALLAFAGEFDNRGPSPEAVRAWTSVLASCDFHACREQITAHYSREHRWIMPADILRGIEIQEATNAVNLVADLDALEPPEWLTAMEDGPEFNLAWVEWRKEQARRIRDGEPLDVAEPKALPVPEDTVKAAVDSLRSALVS